jgi:hypothetical protein
MVLRETSKKTENVHHEFAEMHVQNKNITYPTALEAHLIAAINFNNIIKTISKPFIGIGIFFCQFLKLHNLHVHRNLTTITKQSSRYYSLVGRKTK